MLGIEKTSDNAGQPCTIDVQYGKQRRGMRDSRPTIPIGEWLVIRTTNWLHPRDVLQTLSLALDFAQWLR